jgi:hypothetical protein
MGRAVVLSRYRGRRSRGSLRRFKMSERKELAHDETASTNDRGSRAAELFAAHDPVVQPRPWRTSPGTSTSRQTNWGRSTSASINCTWYMRRNSPGPLCGYPALPAAHLAVAVREDSSLRLPGQPQSLIRACPLSPAPAHFIKRRSPCPGSHRRAVICR